MPHTNHEASTDVQEIESGSRIEILRNLAVQIDPSNPNYLSDYQKVEGVVAETVELYALPGPEVDKFRKYAETLGEESERVQRFFGIKSGLIPKTIFVIGALDKDAPGGYHGAFAFQLSSGDKLQPAIYSPDYRFEFGGERSIPRLVRHEYLHSVDHILGDGQQPLSELIANQIADKVFDIFPELNTESFEEDEADYMEGVLWHMKRREVLPASDELIDIVGESRVLLDKPFVGHPKDSVQEFVVSIMNVMCDEKFEESVAQMTNHQRAAINHLYPFVEDIVRTRVEGLGLVA